MTGLDNPDRTVGGQGAAPVMAQFGEFGNALPVGTRLHEFEILSVIGQGGFGIVYLAHDTTLDRRVAIKEYMPSTLATRTQALTVAVHSAQHAETFAAGLRSFVNEARLLARFDHPSLLKVHRFWEAHGTAYMVMPYYEGTTLGKMLARLGHPPDEALLKALLGPLLDALELMHAAHCFHRDIAPDNILILPDGRPLLLDFGAARRVIGDMTQALTVILKTGYAPVEQYGDIPDMSQGAWTDLYALGSVVQFAITGRTPPQAVTRFMDDRREVLAVVGAGRYSQAFLGAFDQALAVLPKNRPQSVAELRALLGSWLSADRPTIGIPLGAAAAGVDVPIAPSAPALQTHARAAHEAADTTATRQPMPAPAELHADIELESLAPPAPPAVTDTVTHAVAHAAAHPAALLATQVTTHPDTPTAPTTPRRPTRPMVFAGGAALLTAAAAVAGYGWWEGDRAKRAEPVAVTVPIAAPTTAPTAAPIAEPADKPAASQPPEPTAGPATAPPVAPSTPTPRVAETPPPQPPADPAQQIAPETAAAVPVQRTEPSRPARPPAVPRAARTAGQETAAPPPKVGRAPTSARCADIIHRVSIGEEPSDADKTFLKQECGR